MNSLVVLFSVMVLATAKPSYPAIISYAPTVALAPAAVSHQSRIDVKSSPAILKTDIVSPAIASTLVAAPIAYSAPLAIAPAAISSQSHIDIKSTPAVFSNIATSPLAYNAPLAYGAPLAYSAPIAYAAPLTAAYSPSIYAHAIAPAITPALLKSAAIAPEAEDAPASAASADAALPVAPTETPEVAAARAAHLEVKAFEEAHQIQKRSVGIIAAAPVLSSYASPVVRHYISSPIIYSSPIARIAPPLPEPILRSAYGIPTY